MTISRILRPRLTIQEMTKSLIVLLFLPSHHASVIKEIGVLDLLYPTCFQSLYRLLQLMAIADDFRSRRPAIPIFRTLLSMILAPRIPFLTMEHVPQT
jgi:hypothetical protein